MTPRQFAAHAGRTRYVTGQPCRNGHVAERFTSSGGCTECVGGVRKTMLAAMRAVRPVSPGPGDLTRVVEYVHPADEATLRGMAAAFRAGRMRP